MRNKKACNRAFRCLLLLAAIACRKEYPALPYKAVERFVITDEAGAALKAAIQQNNDIVIYWPPFQPAPDSIIPQITVSDQAVIQPASGVKVPFVEGFTWQVTAQDGSKQTYTLKPVINQAPLIVNNISDLQIGKNDFEISGEYFIADTALTKLYLINSRHDTIQLPGADFQVFNTARIYTSIPFSEALDTGYYQVRLVSGLRSVIKGPYYMHRPVLTELGIPDTVRSVQRGGELTVTFSGPAAKYYRQSFGYANVLVGNDIYRMEVTQQTDHTFNLHIPADVPQGSFEYMEIYGTDDGFIYLWERWGNPVTIK